MTTDMAESMMGASDTLARLWRHQPIDAKVTSKVNIEVREHKAPTDESVKLMEEMYEKALGNLIAKVKVEDNLVKGECMAFEVPWNLEGMVRVVIKFAINGQEYKVDRELKRHELMEEETSKFLSQRLLEDYCKDVLLWYVLRKFTTVAFEQITGKKVPESFMR